MREESSGQELKIKEVDTRIEREIADLRTSIQASKVRIYALPRRMRNLQQTQMHHRQQLCSTLLAYVGYYVQTPWMRINRTFFTVTGCSALLMAYLRFRM